MVEWSITVVLKTTVLRGTGGSNPSLSAKSSAMLSSFFYRLVHLSLKFITLRRPNLSKVALKNLFEIHKLHISNLFHIPADFTMQR